MITFFNKKEELLFELLLVPNNNSLVLDGYCTYKYREKFKTKIRATAKLGVKILDIGYYIQKKLVWKIEVRK